MGNNNSKHKLRGIFNKSLMNEVATQRDIVTGKQIGRASCRERVLRLV